MSDSFSESLDEANCLQAAYYADQALQACVEVLANKEVAQETFKLKFACPEMAGRFKPGQFLMLKLTGTDDPLIGRPLALYDIVDGGRAIEVVYVVLGNLTTRLAEAAPGTKLDIWGPLGNGFVPEQTDQLVMVAGGIGHTPMLAVAKEHLGIAGFAGNEPQRFARRVTLCYGARTSSLLAGVDDFQQAGVDVRLVTDDGSTGHEGLVTDVLPDLLEGDNVRVVCCGPEPMMEAVSEMTAKADVPCQVSLETPMACGIGICFTCVTRVRDAHGEWDYKRTCVDGPIFDAKSIVW